MGRWPSRSRHVHPCTCGQQTWLGSAPDVTVAGNHCTGVCVHLPLLVPSPVPSPGHLQAPVSFSIKTKAVHVLKCSRGGGEGQEVLSALWDAARFWGAGLARRRAWKRGWRGAEGITRERVPSHLVPCRPDRVLRAAALLWAPAGPPRCLVPAN